MKSFLRLFFMPTAKFFLIFFSFAPFFPNSAKGASFSLGDILQGYMIYKQADILFGGTKSEKKIGGEVEKAFKSSIKPVQDPALLAWVNEVFDSLKPHITRKDMDYKISALEHPMVNAFALPNGAIFVTRGFLNFVESDDELAGVLSHELAHVEESHSMHLMKKDVIFTNLIGSMLQGDRSAQNLANLAWQFTALEYSRGHEMSADSRGAKIAWQAGYDPNGLIDFLKRLSKQEDREEVAVFMSTHPSDETRISALEQLIKGFKPSVPENMPRNISFIKDGGQIPKTAIVGGNFEAYKVGETPENYSLSKGTIEISTEKSFGGEKSLKIKADGLLSRFYTPKAEMPKEDKTLSMMVYSPNTQPIGRIRFYDKNDKLLSSQDMLIEKYPHSFWFHYYLPISISKPPDNEKRKNPPDNPNNAVRMDIFLGALGDEAIFIDEIIFLNEKKSINNGDTVEIQLVENGDFEMALNVKNKPDYWNVEGLISLIAGKACHGHNSLYFHSPTHEIETMISSPILDINALDTYIFKIASKGNGTIETWIELDDGLGKDPWQKRSTVIKQKMSENFWKSSMGELAFAGPQQNAMRKGKLIIKIKGFKANVDDISFFRIEKGKKPKTWWKKEWDPSEIGWGGNWLPPAKPWLPEGGM